MDTRLVPAQGTRQPRESYRRGLEWLFHQTLRRVLEGWLFSAGDVRTVVYFCVFGRLLRCLVLAPSMTMLRAILGLGLGMTWIHGYLLGNLN